MRTMSSDEQIVENVSENLQRILAERKLSQIDLSVLAGTPQMSVCRLVNGRNMPKLGIVYRVARALNIPVDDLLKPATKKRHQMA